MRIGNAIKQSGFTYMGVLMVVVISGIAMAGAGLIWHQQAQRVKEQELLFVGDAIRQAIRSYYQNTPSGLKEYPPTLEALLLDKRFPNIKRHLRQLYSDPLTTDTDWGLIEQQDRIIGVYSLSKQKPLKQKEFPTKYESFRDAKSYQQWQFVYVPGQD